MNNGARPFEHQVAGSHFSSRSQLLRGEFGRVLKPYKLQQNSPLVDSAATGRAPARNKGTNTENGSTASHGAVCPNEKAFYEMVNSCDKLSKLQALLPRYYGETGVLLGGAVVPHLCLEDLTVHCRLPCVADLKMGAVRDYPGKAPPDRHTEQTKYPSLKEVGWCIAGMRHRSPEGALLASFGPSEGRTLATGRVQEILKSFLTVSCTPTAVQRELLRRILEGLALVAEWFRDQRMFWFRSSSVLLVYNADSLRTTEGEPPAVDDRVSQQQGEDSLGSPRKTELGSRASQEDGRGREKMVTENAVQEVSLSLADSAVERRERIPETTARRETSTLDDTNITRPGTSHSKLQNNQSLEAVNNSVDGDAFIPTKHSQKDAAPAPLETTSRSLVDSSEADRDGRPSLGLGEPSSLSTSSGLIVRVKMIDFAHVLDAHGLEDNNYMLGLDNLIAFLSQLQEQYYTTGK